MAVIEGEVEGGGYLTLCDPRFQLLQDALASGEGVVEGVLLFICFQSRLCLRSELWIFYGDYCLLLLCICIYIYIFLELLVSLLHFLFLSFFFNVSAFQFRMM